MRIKTLNITITLLLVTLLNGCASPEKKHQPSSPVTRQYLEERIKNDPVLTEKTVQNIHILAASLLLGEFGYFDENGYIYWTQRLGDKASPAHRHVLREVQFIRSLQEDKFHELSEVYVELVELCDDKALFPESLHINDQNKAAAYLAAKECMLDRLLNSKAARETYQRHLAIFDFNNNAQLMIKGLGLYESNPSDYGNLNEDDQKALLFAKFQLNSIKTIYRIPIPVKDLDMQWDPDYKILTNLVSLTESNNNHDWKVLTDTSRKILMNTNVPHIDKLYIAEMVATASSLKRRTSPYIEFTDFILENPAATKARKKDWVLARTFFLFEAEHYYIGLLNLDSGLKKL
ncbi:hypothetical protein [Spongorhabdus nitratireducens]